MIRFAFPVTSNRQSFAWRPQIYSDADDTLFDITGSTIKVAIAPDNTGGARYGGVWGGPYYDWDISPRACLLASTADGTVTLPALGTFAFNFTPTQMGSLCPGQYIVGATISRSGITVELFLGTLPVIDGVVPQ